jgi:flagellar motor component MotA
MDIATLLGLAIGISVIVLAILTGSDFYVFLNASGFLIVVCGTFAATLITQTVAPSRQTTRRITARLTVELSCSWTPKTKPNGGIKFSELPGWSCRHVVRRAR